MNVKILKFYTVSSSFWSYKEEDSPDWVKLERGQRAVGTGSKAKGKKMHVTTKCSALSPPDFSY